MVTTFDSLKRGTDFHVGKHFDRLGRLWWEYRCALCTLIARSPSAIDADMQVREHILAEHQEPPC